MVRVWESKSVRHAVSSISKERGDLRWRDQLRILVLDYHERISIVWFYRLNFTSKHGMKRFIFYLFIFFFFSHIKAFNNTVYLTYLF